MVAPLCPPRARLGPGRGRAVGSAVGFAARSGGSPAARSSFADALRVGQAAVLTIARRLAEAFDRRAARYAVDARVGPPATVGSLGPEAGVSGHRALLVASGGLVGAA